MQLIISAINNSNILQLEYDRKLRIVEPYCFGILHNGNAALLAYQIEGGSTSGEEEGWKIFLISRIKSIVVSKNRFTDARPDYKAKDKHMRIIYAAWKPRI